MNRQQKIEKVKELIQQRNEKIIQSAMQICQSATLMEILELCNTESGEFIKIDDLTDSAKTDFVNCMDHAAAQIKFR